MKRYHISETGLPIPGIICTCAKSIKSSLECVTIGDYHKCKWCGTIYILNETSQGPIWFSNRQVSK